MLSLLAAAGLVTGGVVAAAPAASAGGTCSMYATSQFSIGQPYRAVTVPEGPNCAAAGVVEADWIAYHPTKGLVTDAGYEDKARSTRASLILQPDQPRWRQN